MARYKNDNLTRRKGSAIWNLQFRVPPRFLGKPPFGNKLTFFRSLKTTSHSEAVQRRDAFFESIGWFDDERKLAAERAYEEEDRIEREADKVKDGHDHYWESYRSALSGRSVEDLEQEREIVQDYLIEIQETLAAAQDKNPDWGPTPYQAKRLAKLQAQDAGLERGIQETQADPDRPVDDSHPFEITLKRAFDLYRAKLIERKRAPKSIARIGPAFERYKAFNGGRNPILRQIKKNNVFRFIETYQRKGLARSTIENDVSYMSQCWDYIQSSGYISDSLANPFLRHKFVDFDQGGTREPYTEDQIVKLISAMNDDPEIRVLTYIGYYTGMRLEEAFGARLLDQSGTIVFKVAEKGGKTKAATRTIPVHTELAKALAQLGHMPKVGERIPWKTKTSDALGKRFGRVKATVMLAEGVEAHSNLYTFHSLRHGFATRLNAAGYPELHIAELTGHSKGNTGRTEAGKTYIKGLPIARLVEMISSLPTIPGPAAIDKGSNQPRRRAKWVSG